jgi:predicted MFS family arabinose efflux permease
VTRATSMVAAAFALTAITYGLTRFAYGLFLPSIRADLGLSATAAGWIGGVAFAFYCIGVVLAFTLVDRFGERSMAMSAGLLATGAMIIIATSWSGWNLVLAMALGGLSTGLTSPPLASAVAKSVHPAGQTKANGAINAGTAAGIVLSGVAAIAFADDWRVLYASFAGIGLLTTIWLWRAIPPLVSTSGTVTFAWREIQAGGTIGLVTSSFLVGFASTAIWTFGANIMREELDFSASQIALGWIVLGAVGVAGSMAGTLSQRFGLKVVHRLSVALMSLAILALSAAEAFRPFAFMAFGLFGVAYIIATGVLLLWGILIRDRYPALGLAIPFLVVAIGQSAGAPVFGAVWSNSGSAVALAGFAMIMAGATIFSPKIAHSDAQVGYRQVS